MSDDALRNMLRDAIDPFESLRKSPSWGFLTGAYVPEVLNAMFGFSNAMRSIVDTQIKTWDIIKAAYQPTSFIDFGSALGFDGLAQSIAQIQASIFDSIERVTFPFAEVGGFLESLPDLGPLIDQLDDLADRNEDGREALEDGGYGFLTATVALSAYAEFARIHPRAKAAAITNRHLSWIKSVDFEEMLLLPFHNSTVLRRRLPVVEAALAAHRDRSYLLSIPPLLAQIEGTIADAHILKGSVMKKGNKLYERTESGKLRLNKKGEPIEIKGLAHLVRHSKWHTHDVLSGVAGFAVDTLAPDRNDILHGRRHNYGRAKGSVVALLALQIFASEIEVFELGEAKKRQSASPRGSGVNAHQ